MRKNKPVFPAVLCGMIVVGLASNMLVGARADSRDVISVQVRLLQDGAPIDADLDLTFEVYSAETGGTALWTESQTSVPVRNGILAVQLGTTTPLGNLFTNGDGADRWVAIKQGGVDLVPRVNIAAVPYAHGSSAADIASSLWDPVSGGPFDFDELASELAGPGLEADTNDNLRIATATGAGLTGGGGSALAVSPVALINSGTAAIDGDRLEVSYSATNYTPRIGGEALSLDELTAHLLGIDDALASSGGGSGSDPEDSPGFAAVAGGRLTLSSSDAVATTDQASKSTLYYLPYASSKVSLWNATDSTWTIHDIATSTVSISVTGYDPNKNHDVFLYDSSGLTLELVEWTNDSTRVAISPKDGVLVKGASGSQSPERRYLGTIRTITGPYFTDTEQQRFVWNMSNRVARTGANRDNTASWTSSLTTWKRLNEPDTDGDWKFEFVRGLDEDPVEAYLAVGVAGAAGGSYTYIGIALDPTGSPYNPDVTDNVYGAQNAAWAGGDQITIEYRRTVDEGYHVLQGVQATGGATSTFYGGATASIMRMTVIG